MPMDTTSTDYPPDQYPYKIKNWDKFQHFRDRKPIWIKLYRGLLDDKEWKRLEPTLAKTLVELWLLSSETQGYLPDADTIAFRLRMEQKKIVSQISQLNQWIDIRDIKMISPCHQVDALETETETEKDILVHPPKTADAPPAYSPEFQEFWRSYPKRDGSNPKHLAYRAYRAAIKSGAKPAAILEGASRLAQSFAGKPNGERRFIPQAATWINQRRWLDEYEAAVSGGGFSV